MRRFIVVAHGSILEMLLVLSIIALAVQLSWPAVTCWWQLPRPGQTGIDRFESDAIAKTFIIHLPDTYRNEKSWPLVVFLHDSGERGHQPDKLHRVGPFTRQLQAVVAAPQCLPSTGWQPKVVAEFIEQVASDYRIDRDRIYLIGYSMGAYGVWDTTAAYPERFAAVVPISGGGNPDGATC